MSNRTALFPYPHVFNGVSHDGSVLSWPDTCVACKTRECESSNNTHTALCSYGYNYLRVNESMLIAGIVIRDFITMTAARQKRLRFASTNAIDQSTLQRAADTYLALAYGITDEVNTAKQEIIRNYANTGQFQTEFLESVREDMQRGLALFHDYKQINRQISQNINVLIEQGYRGESLAAKLSQAKPAERAIYEASKLLEEKLTVAKFLLNPEWLDQRGECNRFRLHGVVAKYTHIYRSVAERKNVRVMLLGSSYLEVFANPQAVGVIAHTLIDNAIKYSPQNGSVDVILNDEKDMIDFRVTSWGPLIKPSEEDRIFDAFYRGGDARKLEEDGSGYGLYVSQLVAKRHLGCEIFVDQLRSNTRDDRFETTFWLQIPLRARILDVRSS